MAAGSRGGVRRRGGNWIVAAALLAGLAANPVAAQDLARLASWVALDAPTGHEHHATGPLAAQFDGWQTDRFGNLVKSIGSGSPHRVVACALDAYGYAVSQITDDGYLRLHRIGAGSSLRCGTRPTKGSSCAF